MKVRAISLGYFNHRRRYPGDVFEITERKGFIKDNITNKLTPKVYSEDDQYSDIWMERVADDEPITRPRTASELGAADGREETIPADPIIDPNFVDDDPNAEEAREKFEKLTGVDTSKVKLPGVETTPTGDEEVI